MALVAKGTVQYLDASSGETKEAQRARLFASDGRQLNGHLVRQVIANLLLVNAGQADDNMALVQRGANETTIDMSNRLRMIGDNYETLIRRDAVRQALGRVLMLISPDPVYGFSIFDYAGACDLDLDATANRFVTILRQRLHEGGHPEAWVDLWIDRENAHVEGRYVAIVGSMNDDAMRATLAKTYGERVKTEDLELLRSGLITSLMDDFSWRVYELGRATG